ncbi:MAG: cytochrome c oxidase accessory protein CcoG [Magnetococcus sp. DMHC-1]|nr:cytochrome c oxidase accessory protein CcoG [Magnetococcales bacterium]
MSETADSPPSLYESHKKIYPKYQPGLFRNIKWLAMFILLGSYLLFPLLRWTRPAGLPEQAVLFDLPSRKFYIFDLIIWPQEVFLLTFLLIAAAIGLFFMTALAGRVFCGYMCFQTVWTDLFQALEHLIEGNRNKRLRLDKPGWNPEKMVRKLAKHLAWLLVSMVTGWVFVGYFTDAPTLFWEFLHGTAPEAAWITLGIIALTTYTMAGFAREQVCIYMCPYARFQGAMFDQDTLLIAYDEQRGEPRMANRRQRQQGAKAGECIDCQECVRVCPMGIDIRQGQQYQCITCAACIDACNSVMDRIRRPHDLIAYTSMRAMEGKKTRLFRFRVLAYGTLLIGILAGMAWFLIKQKPVELNVLRQRQPVYIVQSDGSIQNNYVVHVTNLSSRMQTYTLQIKDLPEGKLRVVAGGSRLKHQPCGVNPDSVLTVEPGEVAQYTVFVRQPPTATGSGTRQVTFLLQALEPDGGAEHYQSVFMRP